MNILFVVSMEDDLLPNGLIDFQSRIHLGISYISAVLQKQGHRTDLVVLSRLWGKKNGAILEKYISNFQPKLICFTAVVTQYDFIKDIAKHVKQSHPGLYLVVGGVHVTLNPEEALSGDFDAVCVGEGEAPTLELVSQLEKGEIPSKIPNLWIKQRSSVEKNPPREFMRELDPLPFPDRKMWQKWMDNKAPEACTMVLSRGCPYNCSYCSNHALRHIAPGPYVRYRSPQNIIEEIKEIVKEFPSIKHIYLDSETITANIPWCLEVCAALADYNATLKQPISFGSNIRIMPAIDFDKIFAAFKKSNFYMINIGIESGSERVRREILRRNYSNDDVIRTVNLARKYDIKVSFYNLIGVPTETRDDFRETVKINRICKPDRHFTFIFFPFPGTDLHRLCKEQGLLKGSLDVRHVTKTAVLDLPGFPKAEIQKAYDYFDYFVYSGYELEEIGRVDFLRKWHNLFARIPFFYDLLRPFRNFVKSRLKKSD